MSELTNKAIAYIAIHPFTSLSRITARNVDERVKKFVEHQGTLMLRELKSHFGVELETPPMFAGEQLPLLETSLHMASRGAMDRGIDVAFGNGRLTLTTEELKEVAEIRKSRNYNKHHNHIWATAKAIKVLEPLLLTQLSIEYVDKLYLLLDYRRKEQHFRILDRLVYNNTIITNHDESLEDLADFIKDYYNG